MRDILLKYGWTDLGLCKVCYGRAWKYSKVVNGLYYEVKAIIHNTKQGPKEAGWGNMFLPSGKRVRVDVNTIDQELDKHALK